MKGLILKDFMAMKKAFKSYLILFVGYLAIDMMSARSSLTMAVAFIVATMIPIASISYDERSKWDKLVNTMPFSRREIVYSKYILGLMLLVASLVAVFILNKMPVRERFAATASTGIMCIFYQAILIPVLLKYGSEKGRILMMLIMLLPFVAVTMIAKNIDFESMNIGPFINENFFAIATVAVVFTAVLYRLSVALSVKIYKNKEF